MSKKSQRHKAFQSKKKRKHHLPVTAVQQVAAPPRPALPPEASAPPVSAPAPVAKPTVAKYLYITNELKRIGILAGIMLAVLIVLALTLH